VRPKQLIAPVLVTLLLAIFLYAAGTRIVAMAQTGEPVMIAIAIAVSLVLFAILYGIAKEWQMAFTVSRMGEELAARGELPVDDLPRSASGRIDREAADAQFVVLREAVEANEDNWTGWYNLAFGYDAAGDRKRAREALRTAARLYRQESR
jgi:cytochrome c-type biogenesis protein CcmH/NrfG